MHGSGKTAVLVTRIIEKVLKDKIDIDKLLVVTFTNASAAEMRERILENLYKRIEENPDDKNLQRQVILLNKANISTIHSFCLDVIKNYFYEIDISPNFRLGNTEEVELLKQEVLEDLFDEFYNKDDKNFIDLVNIYSNYRSDDDLKELILTIYEFIQSAPYPEKWLNNQTEKFNLSDFEGTEWEKILTQNFREEIENAINTLQSVNIKLQIVGVGGLRRHFTKIQRCYIKRHKRIKKIINKRLFLGRNV